MTDPTSSHGAVASANGPQRVVPSPEQAARMAADMRGNAIDQKNAIARSFDAQRAALLEEVESRKAATLEGLSARGSGAARTDAEAHDHQSAAAGGAAPGSEAPAASPMADPATTTALAGLTSREIDLLLRLMSKAQARNDPTSMLTRLLADTLRDVIAREVRAEVSRIMAAQASESGRIPPNRSAEN